MQGFPDTVTTKQIVTDLACDPHALQNCTFFEVIFMTYIFLTDVCAIKLCMYTVYFNLASVEVNPAFPSSLPFILLLNCTFF